MAKLPNTSVARWLCGAFFSVFIYAGQAGDAGATPISVDPDDFAVGTIIDGAFPGVSLSVHGKPASSVQVLDGFSIFNGRNLATTGSSVFGQSSVHSAAVPQGWDQAGGLLRADFSGLTDFVQIDMIFDDDDFGRLQAFDVSGTLLDTILVSGDGRGPTPFVTATISRVSADIAYILAGGDLGEALFLDNLRFTAKSGSGPVPVPEPSTLALFALGLAAFGLGARLTARGAGVPVSTRNRR